MDTQFSEQEIEQAFADYQAAVAGIAKSGDWAGFADLFTEDATYAVSLHRVGASPVKPGSPFGFGHW